MSNRCPYCDTDEDELDEDLGDHVLECQPWGVETRTDA